MPLSLIASCSIKNLALSTEQAYVIIGCSAAGYYAALELAAHEKKDPIFCLSAEKDFPYDRTSLADVISNKKSSDSIRLSVDKKHRLKFLTNARVTAIDRALQRVTVENYGVLHYKKLLIATGAKPLLPASLSHDVLNNKNIHQVNTQEDIKNIITTIRPHQTIVIVGAGLRALELSDGLTKREPSLNVIMLGRSEGFLGEKSTPLADAFIARHAKAQGVQFFPQTTVSSITHLDSPPLRVTLSTTNVIDAHTIIFAVGTAPNSELAQKAGLSILKNGALSVDDRLMTNDQNIFAAGDVAGFKNPLTDDIMASSKWKAAKEQGITAARNMLNKDTPFHFEPPAYASSFFGLKVFSAGALRSYHDDALLVFSGEHYLYQLALEHNRLKAFILLWKKTQVSPNTIALKNIFTNKEITGIDALKIILKIQ